MSSHVGARDILFTNTTDALLSFNIAGLFEADLLATFEGAGGIVRTSAGFDLLFDLGEGASVTYFPIAPI